MSFIEPKTILTLSSPSQRSRPTDPSEPVRVHEVRPPAVDRSQPVRRTTPTTPLQPLPPIGAATTQKTLTQAEDAVLALITLDPRLAYLSRREVLRLLAALLDPAFDAPKVGRALRRLREYQARGWTFTPAFLPPRHDAHGRAVRLGPPEVGQATVVIEALLRRYAGHGDPPAGRLSYALRLLGHPL